MEIKIKRVDKSLPLPEYKTKGAAGFDLYARESTTIKPGEIKLIPLNVIMEIPTNSWILLANRSSTHKLGITCANGLGIGDSDYCGDNDEYKFPALNFTQNEVTINKGTRIAQATLINLNQAKFIEVNSMNNKNRGGFGSTGLN
jgi:dUTP pyrophosphatase